MASILIAKILGSVGLGSKSASDVALGLAGVGVATLSVGFAATMFARPGQWGVNGADHLRIFAQPVSVPYTGGRMVDRDPGVDMTPIGTVRSRSLSTRSEEPREAKPAPTLPGFSLRGMFQDEAMVQGPKGFQMVKSGSQIEGAGRVIAIEMRGRKMVVVTTGGVIASDD